MVAVPVTRMPVTWRPVMLELNAPLSLWFGICATRLIVSVAVTVYPPVDVSAMENAFSVPLTCEAYKRPSGPNCNDVGFTMLAFSWNCSKLTMAFGSTGRFDAILAFSSCNMLRLRNGRER